MSGKKRTRVEFGSTRSFPARGSRGNGRESRKDLSTYPTTRSCVDATGKSRNKLEKDLVKIAKMEDESARRKQFDKHGESFVAASAFLNHSEIPSSDMEALNRTITTKSNELASLMKKRKDIEVQTVTRKSSTVAFIASSDGKFRDYYGGDAKQSKDILKIVNAYYGCPSNAALEKGINITSAIKDRMLIRNEEILSISDSGNTL
jgi:hypothetical protein